MRLLNMTCAAAGFFLLLPAMLYAASGGKAHDFTLTDINCDTVSLRDFRGKIVVADFWTMWCATCREELPKVHRIHETYAPRGAVVLGIHLEEKNAAAVRSFVEKAGIAYTVLLDPEETTADAFDIRGTPSLVIIDAGGAIAGKYRELDRKTGKEVHRLLDSLITALPRRAADRAGGDQFEDVPVQPPDQ
jgi:peroxiredoxin